MALAHPLELLGLPTRGGRRGVVVGSAGLRRRSGCRNCTGHRIAETPLDARGGTRRARPARAGCRGPSSMQSKSPAWMKRKLVSDSLMPTPMAPIRRRATRQRPGRVHAVLKRWSSTARSLGRQKSTSWISAMSMRATQPIQCSAAHHASRCSRLGAKPSRSRGSRPAASRQAQAMGYGRSWSAAALSRGCCAAPRMRNSLRP